MNKLAVYRLIAIVALLLHACVAQAQEKVRLEDVNARLVRVERVLDKSLLELLQQVEALKREIRVLRGELENQIYELGNARKRNRDLYLDTDQRLTDLEKRSVAPFPGDPLEGEILETDPVIEEPTGSLDVNGEKPVFVATNPETELVEEPEPKASADEEVAKAAPTSEEIATEKAAYSLAYDSLTSGKGDEAVAGFENFLEKFPDGVYADNAWYWQGEARYSQREFDEAIKLFETVVSLFPSSPKVPDARLKIAYALYEQQRFKESRAELAAVVGDYPGRAAGTLASKRLAEMDAKGQ